jgi:hypothetical protein
MKMADAMAAIECGDSYGGFLVSFHWRDGPLLRGDHFPDISAGEKPIESQARAWMLAAAFSTAMGDLIADVYVIHATTFKPVHGYETKVMRSSV